MRKNNLAAVCSAQGIWRANDIKNVKATIAGVTKQTNSSLSHHTTPLDVFSKSQVTMYKIKVTGSRFSSDDPHTIVKEEWVVARRYNGFVTLHKQLKSQVSSLGSRLLLPTLPPKRTLTKGFNEEKFVMERGRDLNEYLQHLLREGNALGGSFELATFLSFIEPIEHVVGSKLNKTEDIFGRRECNRTLIQVDGVKMSSNSNSNSISISNSSSSREEVKKGALGVEIKEVDKQTKTNEDRIVGDNERNSSDDISSPTITIIDKNISNKKSSNNPHPHPYPHHNNNSHKYKRKHSFAHNTALMASVQGRIKTVSYKDVQQNVFELAKVSEAQNGLQTDVMPCFWSRLSPEQPPPALATKRRAVTGKTCHRVPNLSVRKPPYVGATADLAIGLFF